MKKPIAHITDHAVLRYVERQLGIDVEALRTEIGRKVDAAVEAGACGVIVGGVEYRIEGISVVTVLKPGKPDRRIGRRRGRVQDEEAE